MESTTNTATPAATATTASTQNTIVTSTAQPFPTTVRDTTRSWSTAAGSRIIHPISTNRSGQSTRSFRSNHTSTSSNTTVVTSTHARPGSTGPAPPPRNRGTAKAAPAANNA